MILILNSLEIILKRKNVVVLFAVFMYSLLMAFFVYSVEEGESLKSAFKISFNIINFSLSVLFLTNCKTELKNGIAARKISNGHNISKYFNEKQILLIGYITFGVVFYLLESLFLSTAKNFPFYIDFKILLQFILGIYFTANLMLSAYLITKNLFLGFFTYFFLAAIEKGITHYTSFFSSENLPIGSITDIGAGDVNSIYVALFYCVLIFFTTFFIFKIKRRWDC